jgi:RNA polymerase-binding transcription factor DksA
MNLYEYSQLNNTEMGLKVTSENDPKLYHEINEAVKKIVRNSPEFQFEIRKVEKTASDAKTESSKKHPPESQKTTRGFCIRCGAEIPLNPDKPLCFRCFPGWAKFSDPTYPEKFCHVCGKESKQSLDRPVCYSCYKKLYK